MPGIIKATGQTTDSHAGTRSVFNLEDLNQKAQDYLEQVKQQAAKIIGEAQQQAEQLRQEARRQGQREAKNEAKEELKVDLNKQVATVLPALQQAADQLARQREQWQSHWEHAAVKLAIRIAGKLVRHELQHNPQLPVEWIQQTLELISHQEQVTVELSSTDFDALGDQVSQLTERLGRAAPTRLVANPALAAGDCRVTTQQGEIDLQLETQLQRLETELT